MVPWGGLLLWLMVSFAVSAQPQALILETLWHEDDPGCLLQWREVEGFACWESSESEGYYLYYRKAASADLNLAALAEQRSEALCNGAEFFWMNVNEDWMAPPGPDHITDQTHSQVQTLVQFAVVLRCGTASE